MFVWLMFTPMFTRFFTICALVVFASFVPCHVTAAEIAETATSRAAVQSVTPALSADLKQKGFELGAPIFMRIIKSPAFLPPSSSGPLSEGTLELYVQKSGGEFRLYKSYPICAASGEQGAKTKTGDRQSPEGFYFLKADRFNPWSSYHLSLNLGYPNAYDRAQGYTGDYLMIHGKCVSIGCYAMTDGGIDEIYTLARAAVQGGQAVIRVHAFPFPMSEENLAASKDTPHYEFWQNLKHGWDWFETRNAPPNVTVKNKRYVFSSSLP